MGLTSRIKGIKRRGEKLLVTPLIEDFLVSNPEGAIWDDDGLDLFASLVRKTFGTNSDRSGRFGASGRGKCLRRQIFAYIGFPETGIIDTEVLMLFNDGKWRHLRWQMLGIQSGALVRGEVPYRMRKYRVSGAMDGIGDNGDLFGFELKGDRAPIRNFDGSLNEEHMLQIHTMMLAKELDLFSYVMEDKSSQQYREWVIHRDEDTIRKVTEELEELNEYVENRALPPVLEACRAKKAPYTTCPFAGRCLEQRTWRSDGEWDDKDD